MTDAKEPPPEPRGRRRQVFPKNRPSRWVAGISATGQEGTFRRAFKDDIVTGTSNNDVFFVGLIAGAARR
jgi:hypothetical protein